MSNLTVPAGVHNFYSRYHPKDMPCMKVTVSRDASEGEVVEAIHTWLNELKADAKVGDVYDITAPDSGSKDEMTEVLRDRRFGGSWRVAVPVVTRIEIIEPPDSAAVSALRADGSTP